MKNIHRARISALVVGVVAVVLIAFLALRTHASSTATATSLGGKMAPAISGRSLSTNKEFSLKQEHGRFVVIDFFASWCATCIAEEPDLEAFDFAHLHDPKVSLIGVDIDDSLDNARYFVSHYGVTWPTVADSGPIAQSYGVADPPDLFLVDPSGRVVSSISTQVTLAELNNWVHEAEAAKA